jgi:hypothetical protein
MKLLRFRWGRIVAALAILVAVGIVLSSLFGRRTGNQYRRCGHRPELKARLLAFFPYWQWLRGTQRLTSLVTIHGCNGDRARAILETIAFMQSEFKKKNGRPANSLPELVGAKLEGWPQDERSLAGGFQVKYQISPEGWGACIPRQADLPGNYLAVSKGVYFSETGIPTTNDYALSFFK